MENLIQKLASKMKEVDQEIKISKKEKEFASLGCNQKGYPLPSKYVYKKDYMELVEFYKFLNYYKVTSQAIIDKLIENSNSQFLQNLQSKLGEFGEDLIAEGPHYIAVRYDAKMRIIDKLNRVLP